MCSKVGLVECNGQRGIGRQIELRIPLSPVSESMSVICVEDVVGRRGLERT